MTEHRPECIYAPEQFDAEQNIFWGGKPCICEEIERAIERVRQEIDREAFVLDEGDPYREAYRAGYSKGVRDAHESASWCQDPDEMLQAIIGLLNMPPPPPLPPSVGVPEKWRP